MHIARLQNDEMNTTPCAHPSGIVFRLWPRPFTLLLLLLTSLALPGRADTPLPYTLTSEYQSVITSHYIRIEGAGSLDVPFAAAHHLFLQENILDTIQQAYAQLLKEGETPEFTIKQHRVGHWSYVNKADQFSEIIELHRRIDADQPASLVLFTRGERFFGSFRAVITVHVTPVSPETSCYEVEVLAYPENSFSRFFARRLGLAERFFRDKTKEVTDLTVRICRFLTSPDQPCSAASVVRPS